MRMRTLALLALLSLSAAAFPVAAGTLVGAQFRYWSFTDGNDLRDPLVYLQAGPVRAQLEYWQPLRGEEQFRPELGLHVRDARRSSYFVQWRHERSQERLWFGTEQVVRAGWVARASVGPMLPHEGGDPSVLLEGGADRYWGDYSFAGATLVHDPREGGLWVAPVRARFATERNDWLQLTVAPAARRTFGWAVDLKRGILRAGIERNSRFDFTARDNVIFTLGFEARLPGASSGEQR